MKKTLNITQSIKSIASKIFIAGFIISTLSGCVTAAIAVVAIGTVDILHDRRTVGEYVDDGSIELSAKNYLLSKG